MSQIQSVPVGEEARARMTPSAYVTASALREGDPSERELTHVTSDDQRVSIGLWEAQPYAEYVEDYDGLEYTLVLEGRVTLTDEGGDSHTYGPGEAFTIGPGWSGEYRVVEPLLKQFVFYSTDQD